MKRILVVVSLLLLGASLTLGQVTLYEKAIGADDATPGTLVAGDTVFYDISKLDYFGIWVAADSDASFLVYVSVRGSAAGTGMYATSATAVNSISDFTVVDSLTVTAGTSGGGKFIALRSGVAEAIPFGCNFMMVRLLNKASGNGSLTKNKRVVLDGIKFRDWRPGD